MISKNAFFCDDRSPVFRTVKIISNPRRRVETSQMWHTSAPQSRPKGWWCPCARAAWATREGSPSSPSRVARRRMRTTAPWPCCRTAPCHPRQPLRACGRVIRKREKEGDSLERRVERRERRPAAHEALGLLGDDPLVLLDGTSMDGLLNPSQRVRVVARHKPSASEELRGEGEGEGVCV